MSKIIIENRSDLQDYEAVELVLNVMKEAKRYSIGMNYSPLSICHKATLTTTKVYQTAYFDNKKSDRFVVCNND